MGPDHLDIIGPIEDVAAQMCRSTLTRKYFGIPVVVSSSRTVWSRNGRRGDRGASSIQQQHTSSNLTSGPRHLSTSMVWALYGNLPEA